MNALEKAKIALRKHLLANKDDVLKDLNAMRSKSTGNDIFNYVENLSGAYSLSHLNTSKEIVFDYPFIETKHFADEITEYSFYTPPNNNIFTNTKKDSEITSGSFFFLILCYVRSRKSWIFF